MGTNCRFFLDVDSVRTDFSFVKDEELRNKKQINLLLIPNDNSIAKFEPEIKIFSSIPLQIFANTGPMMAFVNGASEDIQIANMIPSKSFCTLQGDKHETVLCAAFSNDGRKFAFASINLEGYVWIHIWETIEWEKKPLVGIVFLSIILFYN